MPLRVARPAKWRSTSIGPQWELYDGEQAAAVFIGKPSFSDKPRWRHTMPA